MKHKKQTKRKPLTEERVREIVREETNKGISMDDMEVTVTDKRTGKVICRKGLVYGLTVDQPPWSLGKRVDLTAVFDNIEM